MRAFPFLLLPSVALLSAPATVLADDTYLTTLYAADPIASTLCLTDTQYGAVIRDLGVFNRCSHVALDPTAGNLKIGIQGGELGSVLDLGSTEELARRYAYKETISGGQGFASLHRQAGQFRILKEARPRTFQPISERFPEPRSRAPIGIKVGHVYLFRITRPDAPEIIGKLLLVASTPGQSGTFRWALMGGGA